MIKSKVNNNSKQPKLFPKLMIEKGSPSNKFIVLMLNGTGEGVLVSSPSMSFLNVGYYSKGWVMRNFVDFDGIIELSNEMI